MKLYLLCAVQPLPQLAHGARVGRPPEDAHRRRALRHDLQQHRLEVEEIIGFQEYAEKNDRNLRKRLGTLKGTQYRLWWKS